MDYSVTPLVYAMGARCQCVYCGYVWLVRRVREHLLSNVRDVRRVGGVVLIIFWLFIKTEMILIRILGAWLREWKVQLIR